MIRPSQSNPIQTNLIQANPISAHRNNCFSMREREPALAGKREVQIRAGVTAVHITGASAFQRTPTSRPHNGVTSCDSQASSLLDLQLSFI